MRKTSKDAIREIRADGTLTGLQRMAYRALMKHEPATAAELGRTTGVEGIWKRLSELERAGLVIATASRQCKVTGRKAMVWQIRRDDDKADKAVQ